MFSSTTYVIRGARVSGFVSGWGCTADAHHMTRPDPEGRGAEERQSLVRRFRDGLKARIATNPEAASCAWRVFTMLIAKDA